MKTAGLVICALLALLDLAGALPVGGELPPAGVIIAGVVLGVVTLAALVPAWRGRRRGLQIVVASRVVSALLGIGAFVDDAAPDWARAGVTIALILTAVAVALIYKPVPDRVA